MNCLEQVKHATRICTEILKLYEYDKAQILSNAVLQCSHALGTCFHAIGKSKETKYNAKETFAAAYRVIRVCKYVESAWFRPIDYSRSVIDVPSLVDAAPCRRRVAVLRLGSSERLALARNMRACQPVQYVLYFVVQSLTVSCSTAAGKVHFSSFRNTARTNIAREKTQRFPLPLHLPVRI